MSAHREARRLSLAPSAIANRLVAGLRACRHRRGAKASSNSALVLPALGSQRVVTANCIWPQVALSQFAGPGADVQERHNFDDVRVVNEAARTVRGSVPFSGHQLLHVPR